MDNFKLEENKKVQPRFRMILNDHLDSFELLNDRDRSRLKMNIHFRKL